MQRQIPVSKTLSNVGLIFENKVFERLLLIGMMVLFGMWAVFRGQDANWDLLDYHFYNGFAFLHQRYKLDLAPAAVQTYLNPFFDVINYFLITIQKPVITIFIFGSLSGLSAFFLYKIALIIFENNTPIERAIYSLAALLIGSTGAAGIGTLGLTTNDNKMTLLVMAALFCIFRFKIS